MADEDRLNRPELQAKVDQVSGNTPEIVREVDRASVLGSPPTRSRTTFPARAEGRDGDEVMVNNGGRVFLCKKVRGKWERFGNSEAVTEAVASAANETVAKAVDKAGGSGSASSLLLLKTEDEVLSTNVAFQDDDHMVSPILKVNTAYLIELRLFWTHDTSGRGVRYRIWAFDGQTDITGYYASDFAISGAAAYTIGTGFINTTATAGVNMMSSCHGVLITGSMSGRIGIQWGVGAAVAGSTTMRRGSLLQFTELGRVT